MNAELLGYGTATLAQALGRRCWVDESIRSVWSGATAVGPALTVRAGQGDNLAIHRALDVSRGGDVLVVDAGGAPFGYWGEIMSAAATKKGAAAVVIDGGVRDTSKIEDLRFPVFASSRSIESTTKLDPGDIGVAVTVGGIEVVNGDWVVADADAVVVIPVADLTHVIATSRRIQEREAVVIDGISRGRSTLDLLEL